MRLKITICKMTEEDHFISGCDPETTRDHGTIMDFTCNKKELFDAIEAQVGFHKDELTAYENRLEVSQLEGPEGYTASKEQISLWESDDSMRLWHASYSIYIDEVRTTNINNMEEYVKSIACGSGQNWKEQHGTKGLV